jgi:cytidylate kinase
MRELAEKGLGDTETYERVLADIVARDKQDSERTVAPLKPAADAVVLDTTDKTLDEVTGAVLALIAARR